MERCGDPVLAQVQQYSRRSKKIIVITCIIRIVSLFDFSATVTTILDITDCPNSLLVKKFESISLSHLVPKKPAPFHCQKTVCYFTYRNYEYMHGFVFPWSHGAFNLRIYWQLRLREHLCQILSIVYMYQTGWESWNWNYVLGSHKNLRKREDGSCWGLLRGENLTHIIANIDT